MKVPTVEQLRKIITEKIPEGLIVPAHDDKGHHYRHVPSGKVFDSVTTFQGSVIDKPELKNWASRLAVEYLSNHLVFNPEILNNPIQLVKLQEESITQHKDNLDDAASAGTSGHLCVEKFTNKWMETEIMPTSLEEFITGNDSRDWAILRSAISFFVDFYVIPVASELLVCNLKDEYAGTLDNLSFIIITNQKCTQPSGRHDFMWKTSSSDWRKVECVICGAKEKYRLALIDLKTSNSIQNKPAYYTQVAAYAKAFRMITGIKIDDLIILRLDKKQAKYEPLRVVNPTDCYKGFLLMKKLSQWLIKAKNGCAEPVFSKEIIKIT